MQVVIIRAWPHCHESRSLTLISGATVADAIKQAAWDLDGVGGYAVYGERVSADAVLHDGDRLELLRPLQIDPKQARRRRALKTGGR